MLVIYHWARFTGLFQCSCGMGPVHHTQNKYVEYDSYPTGEGLLFADYRTNSI